MAKQCQHRFDEVPMVFTGTLRTRACRACDHIEVLLVPLTGGWLNLEEYLSRRIDAQAEVIEAGKPTGRGFAHHRSR